MKKTTLLVLTVLGFLAPNILVIKVSIETGNILLWTHPAATIAAAFGNDISSAFLIDLLFVVSVFFIWTYTTAKQLAIKNVWLYWLLALLFGMAGVLPLFLYQIEKKKKKV
jgi:hypothetical protein